MPYLRVEVAGDHTRVTILQSRLSLEAAGPIGDQLKGLAEARAHPRLFLDLGRVECVSGAALAGFVSLHQTVRAANGALTLENVRPFVHEAFKLTGLTKVLDVRCREASGPVEPTVVIQDVTPMERLR